MWWYLLNGSTGLDRTTVNPFSSVVMTKKTNRDATIKQSRAYRKLLGMKHEGAHDQSMTPLPLFVLY